MRPAHFACLGKSARTFANFATKGAPDAAKSGATTENRDGQGPDEKEQGSAEAEEGEGEDHRRQPAAQPPGAFEEQLGGGLRGT